MLFHTETKRHVNFSRQTEPLFLVDEEQGELCSKVADGVPVIRIPKTKGVVGWVVSNGKMLRKMLPDDRFNPEVDKETGYKTNSICVVQYMIRQCRKLLVQFKLSTN